MNRRWIAGFLWLTIVWYVATMATAIFGITISMSTFEDGGPVPWQGRILNMAFMALSFPASLLFWISPKSAVFSGALTGHALLMLNSALWAAIFTYGARRILKRRNAS